MDQTFAAGVGNWIADEVLYQAGIAPLRKADTLSKQEVQRMRAKLKHIIGLAVRVGADKKRFPSTWLFHHRWGRNPKAETRAGEPIEHIKVGGRTTAWVPRRQR
jgi:formamidopyrimidine-DNA glycosylase